MTDKKPPEYIKIPDNNVEFRKFIKNLTCEKLKGFDKDQLQKLYDKSIEFYPDSGGQISRKERENLHAIQEGLFGELDSKLQVILENIGATLVKKLDKRKKTIDYNLPCAGSVLVRNWKGKNLEIKIVGSGFEYDGDIYSSLSKLAKKIAGYAVSGPIFFGLRKPKIRATS